MKALALILVLGMVGGVVHAEETMGDKATATGNDVKRAVKKGAHRTGEAMCAEGDAKCAGKKLKNRGTEAKDATVDKVDDTKNQVKDSAK